MLIKKPENHKYYQYQMVDDNVVEYKQIVVYRFEIDDFAHQNNIRALEHLNEWLESDQAKWITKNAAEHPYYDYCKRYDTQTVQYAVVAIIEAKKLTEYYLRFG